MNPLSPTPGWRRLTFHAGLAAIVSPIPGAAVVAGRASQTRGLGTALLAAAFPAAITLSGLALALTAPWEWQRLAAVLAVLWLLAGLATGLAEWKLGVEPPPLRQERSPSDLLAWAAGVTLAWSPLAILLAMIASRWGTDLLRKPSFPAAFAAAAVAGLVPLGLLIGLSRYLRRRGSSLAGPVLLAVTPWVVLALLVGVGLLQQWVVGELLELPELTLEPPNTGVSGIEVTEAVLGCIFLYLLLEHLCEAATTSQFLRRSLVALGLFLVWMAVDVGVTTGPVALRERLATRALGAGRPGDAARHWRFMLARAPLAPHAAATIERGAAAALAAGDAQLARDILERATPELLREYPADETVATAAALLGSSAALDPARAIRPPVELIVPESYLSADWCAVLTAVRAVTTGRSEAELKSALRALSLSDSAVRLSGIVGFGDVRVAVRALGAELVPVATDSWRAVLARGRPLLFREPASGIWMVVTASYPAARAVEWLDYRRWDRERAAAAKRSEVERLLASEEGLDEERARVKASITRLAAESRILATWEADAWSVAAVVAPGEASPEEVALGDEATRLSLARDGVGATALANATRLATALGPGPTRDEALALAEVAAHATALRMDEPVAALSAPARELLTPAGIDRLTPWGLLTLCTSAGVLPELDCVTERRLVARLGLLHPGSYTMQAQRLWAAVDASDPVEAAQAALAFARNRRHERRATLHALDLLAPLAAQEGPALAAVRDLRRRISWIASGGDATKLSWYEPAWWAAEAALAPDPRAAVVAWRRALDLAPDNGRFAAALAVALDRAGEPAAAAETRRLAEPLAALAVCPGRHPRCLPTFAELNEGALP